MQPTDDKLPHFSAAGREVAANIIASYDASAFQHRIRLPQALPRDSHRGYGDFAIDHHQDNLLQPSERLQSALLRHRQQAGYAEVSAFVTKALQSTATPEPQRVTSVIATLRQAAQQQKPLI